ncbi:MULTISPECIES: LolA family protein [Streptomycetaceae]|uniref:Outer membrane lipoprotein-sorting protein n=1 Tax=Streptantibioticus cattleyicolor (strain ATCC 35852 / DSM 46488 / JCM 4925 / NBRC 14057 / NRRL 8057) TaxID=1003195 RepID=F8JXH7_STREN|nr:MULTISPECIES: membrane protein [Streptomycetaceae]AEW95859.1 hypothetical protein SCATT_34880 [Streptantibioticus cattleyicolor NRRL 8057 = DSM 46488]MYS60401.1 DUF2092 domain-containing protein [Streptomyces sp. SID5468]CCB76196.1 putative membrane protein [Streptantibioticus cattleyicolor NRRL 8057 = DSM 46488]
MAPIQPPQPGEDFGGNADFAEDAGLGRRRKLVRYGVPVAVAGVAAATIGLGTALATTGGGPALPHVTAEQLLAKVAGSDVQTVSGSVKISTDFGLPAGIDGLAGNLGGATGGSPFGSGAVQGHGAKGGDGSAADPTTRLTGLLTGDHTLRVAADGPDRQRLSIVEGTSEYTLVHNGTQVWGYDSAGNAVFHATEPAGARERHAKGAPDDRLPATPQEAARQILKAVGPTTSVSVGDTAEVAGRSAYQLVIRPKQADTTVDSVRIAVDAHNGAPLRFTLTPKGSAKAAVDIGYTKVDFGKPAASTFEFTVPKGAKVTEGGAAHEGGKAPGDKLPHGAFRPGHGHRDGSGLNTLGTGWDTVVKLDGAPGALPHGGGAPGKAGGGLDLLGSLGHRVTGAFGSGTVINTRLVNVLITDKGAVYAGAVTQDALVKAAGSAAK